MKKRFDFMALMVGLCGIVGVAAAILTVLFVAYCIAQIVG